MKINADTPDKYIEQLPHGRQQAISRLRKVIIDNIPVGFEETMSYGMIGYVVPHSLYPEGYHPNPKLPLPFLNLASQKNHIALYHMGLYSDNKLMEWFKKEYPKHCKYKLDMGKSCIRFKKIEDIPYNLIAELVSRITPSQCIALYESQIKR